MVAHPDLLHGDLYFRAVPENMGGFRGQIHQAVDGLGGLALGALLQKLAQGDEGEDHAGGLKVQIHVVARYQLHVAVAQAVANLVDGEDTVNHCRRRAYGDERVHIGSPVPQGFEADLIVGIVDI